MSDSSNRADDPDRAENGTFQKGHKKLGGRSKGKRNIMTAAIKEAVMSLAEEHGRDGQGLGGRIGYLRFLAAKHPGSFSSQLLGKLIPRSGR
jgi:hypothetical protein